MTLAGHPPAKLFYVHTDYGGDYLGKGFTTRAFKRIDNNGVEVVIKITDLKKGTGRAGVYVDNYGYRILEDLMQKGEIDTTRLHEPEVYRQFTSGDDFIVTVVEKGPENVLDLKNALDDVLLTPSMTKAVQ